MLSPPYDHETSAQVTALALSLLQLQCWEILADRSTHILNQRLAIHLKPSLPADVAFKLFQWQSDSASEIVQQWNEQKPSKTMYRVLDEETVQSCCEFQSFDGGRRGVVVLELGGEHKWYFHNIIEVKDKSQFYGNKWYSTLEEAQKAYDDICIESLVSALHTHITRERKNT